MNDKNFINESIGEVKNIPPDGKINRSEIDPNRIDFKRTFDIYKVIERQHISSYSKGYDRKKSDGWTKNGRDCYGIVGYTHLLLKGAMQLLSYGGNIVRMKLLGGLNRFVFFDADRDPDIKRALIQIYGNDLSVRDQLYVLTGDASVADEYGRRLNGWGAAAEFGKKYGEEIMRRTGKYIRGFVCEYSDGDAMVAPFNFGDMIPVAVAENVRYGESIDSVATRFRWLFGKEQRLVQDDLIDIVPHLYMVNALDPDGGQCARIGDKLYAAYTSKSGAHNILIIDDRNWTRPNDVKLFPDDIKLDYELSNPTRKGNLSFSMRGQTYIANVLGIMTNGKNATDDNGQPVNFPIFAMRGYEDEGWWWPMTHDNLAWFYNNPEETKNLKAEYYADNQYQEVSESVKKILKEGFKPGMTYNDFVKDRYNQTIMYVCTHCYNLEGVMQYGFSREYANANDSADNGGMLTYGEGVYGTPSLDNAANNLARKGYSPSEKPDGKKYGDVILKCVLLGGWKNFLIFDGDKAREIYGNKWRIEDQIKTIVKDPKAVQEFLSYMNSFNHGELYDPKIDRTTGIIFRMFNSSYNLASRKVEYDRWTNFFRKNGVRGCIYTGYGDKYSCVCYDYSEVIPILISYDYGKTWTTGGMKRTLPYNGKTYVSGGIDWDSISNRLTTGGDPRGKLGSMYAEVDVSPQAVKFFGGAVTGVVQVKTKNGRYNFITLQDVPGNDGSMLYRKNNKIFPVDFDDKATISGLRGTVRFKYRGIDFTGKVYDENANGPVVLIRKRNGIYNTVEELPYSMEYLDWIVDNYEPFINGEFDSEEEDNYEEQGDTATNQELQEEFFKMLDKIELI